MNVADIIGAALGLDQKSWFILAKEFVSTLHSIDEAYRLRHKLPAPTELPEDWDKLIAEPSTVDELPDPPA